MSTSTNAMTKITQRLCGGCHCWNHGRPRVRW